MARNILNKLLALALLFASFAVHAAITVVQVGSVGQFNGTALTAQSVLSGVASGDDIIACVSHQDFGSTAPTITVSDGASYTADSQLQIQNAYYSGVFRLNSVSSGTHTIIATASSGTTGNSFGSVTAIEVSGLASSPVDQVPTPGNSTSSTTPGVGPTGALASANELLVVCIASNGSMAGGTWPPTGGPGTFTSMYNGLTNSAAAAYQVQTTGTAAVTVAMGTISTAHAYVMPLVTYMAAPSTSGGAIMLRGVGKNMPAANDDHFHLLLTARNSR